MDINQVNKIVNKQLASAAVCNQAPFKAGVPFSTNFIQNSAYINVAITFGSPRLDEGTLQFEWFPAKMTDKSKNFFFGTFTVRFNINPSDRYQSSQERIEREVRAISQKWHYANDSKLADFNSSK